MSAQASVPVWDETRVTCGAQPGSRPDADRLRPALGRGLHLCCSTRSADGSSAEPWTCICRRALHERTEDGARGTAPSPRQPDPSLRSGVQYCGEYTVLLEAHGIQPSMSRV